VARSGVAAAQLSGQPARDCLRPPSLRVGQQHQQNRLCGSGKRLKTLRLRHSSLRASIRVIYFIRVSDLCLSCIFLCL